MKKLNIKDIAKLAHVAPGTVSKVINNYDTIPEETKNRIKAIIKKHNFHSFESAHSLAKGRTNVIAFMAPKYASPFISEILEGFETRSIETNRFVNDIVTYSTRGDIKVRNELFNKILYGVKPAALVLLSITPSRKQVADYKKFNIPVIMIGNRIKGTHSVTADNYKGAYVAAEYLIKNGKRNIALVSGRFDENEICEFDMAVIDRKLGFDAALKKHGIKMPSENLVVVHDFKYEDGIKAFEELSARGASPDAVFCAAGDITAMGIMEAAQKKGIKIPRDMAVISFDDMMFSEHLNPPLTTVRQPIQKLGSAAFDTAVAAIEGRLNKPTDTILPTELVIRRSA